EWEKVVAHYEKQLQAIYKNPGIHCDIEATLAGAQWKVAEARAGLAQVRGEKPALAAELKKVVAYHEWLGKRYGDYLEKRAIRPEDLDAAKHDLEEARKRWKKALDQSATPTKEDSSRTSTCSEKGKK